MIKNALAMISPDPRRAAHDMMAFPKETIADAGRNCRSNTMRTGSARAEMSGAGSEVLGWAAGRSF
jgi:hypothetical protein